LFFKKKYGFVKITDTSGPFFEILTTCNILIFFAGFYAINLKGWVLKKASVLKHLNLKK
jgi:hypothetical protein